MPLICLTSHMHVVSLAKEICGETDNGQRWFVKGTGEEHYDAFVGGEFLKGSTGASKICVLH